MSLGDSSKYRSDRQPDLRDVGLGSSSEHRVRVVNGFLIAGGIPTGGPSTAGAVQ